jgi:hypothetical protein
LSVDYILDIYSNFYLHFGLQSLFDEIVFFFDDIFAYQIIFEPLECPFAIQFSLLKLGVFPNMEILGQNVFCVKSDPTFAIQYLKRGSKCC